MGPAWISQHTLGQAGIHCCISLQDCVALKTHIWFALLLQRMSKSSGVLSGRGWQLTAKVVILGAREACGCLKLVLDQQTWVSVFLYLRGLLGKWSKLSIRAPCSRAEESVECLAEWTLLQNFLSWWSFNLICALWGRNSEFRSLSFQHLQRGQGPDFVPVTTKSTGWCGWVHLLFDEQHGFVPDEYWGTVSAGFLGSAFFLFKPKFSQWMLKPRYVPRCWHASLSQWRDWWVV